MMVTTKKREEKNPHSKKNIALLKAKEYRGFRFRGEGVKTEFSFEVTAYNNLNDRLIAIGKTPDEAYENLITRIDEVLDGS